MFADKQYRRSSKTDTQSEKYTIEILKKNRWLIHEFILNKCNVSNLVYL